MFINRKKINKHRLLLKLLIYLYYFHSFIIIKLINICILYEKKNYKIEIFTQILPLEDQNEYILLITPGLSALILNSFFGALGIKRPEMGRKLIFNHYYFIIFCLSLCLDANTHSNSRRVARFSSKGLDFHFLL